MNERTATGSEAWSCATPPRRTWRRSRGSTPIMSSGGSRPSRRLRRPTRRCWRAGAKVLASRRALSRRRDRRRNRRLLLRRALSCAPGLSSSRSKTSVYVAPGRGGRGVGGALLAELIARCEAGPWRQMVAIIGDSDKSASIALHRRYGFEPVGTLRSVGFKFGRWVDTPIMQRVLGPGDSRPPDDLTATPAR